VSAPRYCLQHQINIEIACTANDIRARISQKEKAAAVADELSDEF
jgi:hypothetical protein